MLKSKQSFEIILWIIVLQTIAYFLGLITRMDIQPWYNNLHKSSLTPPAFVFPIVWSILYTMLAIIGWDLWRQRHKHGANIALGLYGSQMLLNWSWTPLFFHWHLIGVSFICLLAIALLTLATILVTMRNFRFISLMLLPYFLWLIIANYLNYSIWLRID
jgi:translocator protein